MPTTLKQADVIVRSVIGPFDFFEDDEELHVPKGTKVISKDGEIGVATGGQYACQMEGCTGTRVVVRWPDGEQTRPCTDGMTKKADVWYI